MKHDVVILAIVVDGDNQKVKLLITVRLAAIQSMMLHGIVRILATKVTTTTVLLLVVVEMEIFSILRTAATTKLAWIM
jgi:hypothetical protein